MSRFRLLPNFSVVSENSISEAEEEPASVYVAANCTSLPILDQSVYEQKKRTATHTNWPVCPLNFYAIRNAIFRVVVVNLVGL